MQFRSGILLTSIVIAAACACTAALAQDQSKAPLPPGVVAEQGGAQVTLQDIDAFAAKIPEQNRAGFFDSPKRIESTIMGLLLQKQLAAQARAGGLEKDPLVQRRIQLATEDTLASVQLEHYKAALKLPDFNELAHEYYLAHKSEFVAPGEVDVKHVLVSNKNRGDDEAKARIGKVEATARAHPDQFDALIAKYSDDPSVKDNHGLIKDAASGQMAAPFAKAAAELKKPGDISPIVKTEFGYHVLKLVAHKPDRQKSFDEIRDGLVQKLRKDWIDQRMVQYTGDLRGKPLDASPELVASLRVRYLPPGTITPQEAQEAADRLAAEKKKAAEKQAGEAKH
ncbi:MAG: peptidylprolyl isomerase [Xanthomonadaceae bacterium]|nr:peptidylprolyl isomerase [Xanthomonadaceae bacterium]